MVLVSRLGSVVVEAAGVISLPTDAFLFLGFLPRQKTARQAALADVAALPYTLVLYEAPHRLLALLGDLQKVFGERQVVVGRELTKLYEEIWRGTVAEAIAYFGQDKIRGEITVVVAGADESEQVWDETAVRKAVTKAIEQGASRKDAAAQVAERSGWRKRDVYNLTLS